MNCFNAQSLQHFALTAWQYKEIWVMLMEILHERRRSPHFQNARTRFKVINAVGTDVTSHITSEAGCREISSHERAFVISFVLDMTIRSRQEAYLRDLVRAPRDCPMKQGHVILESVVNILEVAVVQYRNLHPLHHISVM